MQITHFRPQFISEDRGFLLRSPIVGAERTLRAVLTLVPLACGFDKLARLVAPWESYLPHEIVRRSPIPLRQLLDVVGVVEIGVALLVALAPRAGAAIVMLWLLLEATCMAQTGHVELALRDGALAFVALALARLETGARLI